jgi:hypothetical protein
MIVEDEDAGPGAGCGIELDREGLSFRNEANHDGHTSTSVERSSVCKRWR